MSRKKKIAEPEEVLEYLTRILRGQPARKTQYKSGEERELEITERESMKAAELMGKRYALFDDRGEADTEITVKVEYGDH